MKGYRNWDQRWVLGRRALIATFFCAEIACLFGSGTQPAIAPKRTPSCSAAPEKVFRESLTFGERVAYQRAIEEVYWRHRIWPKENARPKPLLDAVISRAALERKVHDYLRQSHALEDYWQRPIAAEQLQAEMDRMASRTKQPEVLHELFAALGNDPFVIAESLARPILVERLLSSLTTGAKPVSFKASLRNPATLSAYNLPEISPNDCTDDAWTATSTTNAPAARYFHTAIWTGSEMIVWGGFTGLSYLNTGGRYDPATDNWTAVSTSNAPAGRYLHTAVWSGSEMIVWSGTGDGFFNTGGRYNPNTDSWTATSTTGVPAGRYYHTAVWTGSQMIVWGGYDGNRLNTGGSYDPSTDSWTATNTTGAPAGRAYHTAVWTGRQMVVWGGLGDSSYLNTGGRYNPATDSWTATSISNAPAARAQQKGVWTGTEMIIWSGFSNSGLLNSGGRYDPSTNMWTATSTTGAPNGRSSETAVWTGRQMIVWGGWDDNNVLNTGGRYDPSTDSWTATSTTGAPGARQVHTAVWIGSQMLVWGGVDSNSALTTGGRYCVDPSTPIVQSAVSRKTHGSVGNFDVDLPLSGTPGVECRSGGGANDYTIVLTFLANVSVNGSPQAAVSSGIGTIGSGGVSNGGMVITSGNVVTIPLTNVTNAQTINVTLNNVNGATNVMLPMRVLVGDVNGNGTVNATDVAQTKLCVGQAVSATDFRCDVNAGGTINATDVSQVKVNSGHGLP